MRFLIRSAFWLGLVFHAMPWGDVRLSDIAPSPAQTLAAGLALESGDAGAAGAIARAALRGALEPDPAGETARSPSLEPPAKAKRASTDTLSVADRAPTWRGVGLRGTL